MDPFHVLKENFFRSLCANVRSVFFLKILLRSFAPKRVVRTFSGLLNADSFAGLVRVPFQDSMRQFIGKRLFSGLLLIQL